MRFRNTIIGALLSVVMLIPAAPAFAQPSAQDGYTPPRGSIQERIERSNDPGDPQARTETRAATADPADPGDLPFTGLDVALILGAGGLLLAMGFGIRRVSRSEVV